MSTDGGRRYGGRTPDERRADRRRRLLDTALDLFGTEGYSTVGIERLCATAGVTARHFYEEFGSREGLLTAVYDEIIADGSAAVTAALAATSTDQEARTRAGVGAFVHHLLDDPRRARIACLEVVGVSPDLERHRRSVLHLFATVVEGQAAEIGIVERLPEADRPFSTITLALVGGVNELFIEWLTDPDAMTVDGLVADIVYLFVAVGRAGELPAMPPRGSR